MTREKLQIVLDAVANSTKRYRRSPTEAAVRGELTPHDVEQLLPDPFYKDIGLLSRAALIDLAALGCIRGVPDKRGRRHIIRWQIRSNVLPDPGRRHPTHGGPAPPSPTAAAPAAPS